MKWYKKNLFLQLLTETAKRYHYTSSHPAQRGLNCSLQCRPQYSFLSQQKYIKSTSPSLSTQQLKHWGCHANWSPNLPAKIAGSPALIVDEHVLQRKVEETAPRAAPKQCKTTTNFNAKTTFSALYSQFLTTVEYGEELELLSTSWYKISTSWIHNTAE